MSTQERILICRLIKKIDERPKYAESIGINYSVNNDETECRREEKVPLIHEIEEP